MLKNKVQDLSEENVALRDINIKFQLENFKLQQKIKKLENSQFDDCIGEVEVCDVSKNDSPNISMNESTFDPSAEYLEEDYVQSPENIRANQQGDEVPKSPELGTFSLDNVQSVNKVKIFKQEEEAFDPYVIEEILPDGSSILIPKDETEIAETESNDTVDPKTATQTIYMLAAKRGVAHRIKAIEKGKQKDSSFVNKILDLVFDRKTLANSSARGKKCQAMPHKPARPALDENKLEMCRQAFLYRLKQEELSYTKREERLRHFNGYVNFKIQNARKLLKK